MWWEKAVFYEIYLPSFADSNGDGIGDFNGIKERLPYLKQLGIDALWLTPFYPSPKIDNGYDVSDYCDVDRQYGTLQDLEELIQVAKKSGMHVIIDVVFNHTSTQHPWFQSALQSTEDKKRDWYIWRDRPNNWESFFGGSAWEYDEKSQQYYYHSFAKEQADLNWHNPAVKHAIFQILDFWIKKGIDGFRFDVINNLTVSQDFKDNPVDETRRQIHQNDVNQPGVLAILKEINAYIKNCNPELFTVAEISSDDLKCIEQYVGAELFDTAFNFNLGSQEKLNLNYFASQYEAMNTAAEKLPTLFFNSHDMSRSWERLADKNVDVYYLLIVLLTINHGITFLFQGEELGLGDFLAANLTDIRDIQAKNKYFELLPSDGEVRAIAAANLVNRDRSRGMLPFNIKGWIGSAKVNESEKVIMAGYKALIALRHKEGPFLPLEKIQAENDLLSYWSGDIHVILNFSEKPRQIELLEDRPWQTLWSHNGPYLAKNKIYLPERAGWIGKRN
ncbi:alpha-amylase family glycosyl hydrolase [Enterococcus canintestini]|uniref:alpha-amylase family glycosyl hydrolase n=1 Tax=Enterococcus canintestini TaxID=317010 RepID=UPI00288E8DE4|nr:alpha-amylase family glycosyl hydrolase [Enterococcus canintestini]MDT2739991.1 alpha-amylase family glycosyl hydrolase [Enterococcus canintestini]